MAIKWSGWELLGKPRETEIGRPFAQRNQDGRLEVFAIGLGRIFNIAQSVPNGGWRDGWRDKGSPSSSTRIKLHVVGRNADGRLEIVAVADDNALWQKWQVAPNNGWSEWNRLGKPLADVSLTDRFTAGRNQDGRQEIFVLGSDGNIWQIWQTVPNGGWSQWAKLGAPSPGIRGSDRITVGRNRDGRQQLFVMGLLGEPPEDRWQTALALRLALKTRPPCTRFHRPESLSLKTKTQQRAGYRPPPAAELRAASAAPPPRRRRGRRSARRRGREAFMAASKPSRWPGFCSMAEWAGILPTL